MIELLLRLLCAGLFILGAAFLVRRRELLAMLIGLELMINAANLMIVRTALARGDAHGLAAALIVIAAAAAEAAVGVALILALYRDFAEPEAEEIRELQG